MTRRSVAAADLAATAALFAWLIWIPLPFGSNIPAAWLPLLLVPFAVSGTAALCRWWSGSATPPPAWNISLAGAAAFMGLGLLQLVPLPPWLLRAVSPEAWTIWNGATAVQSLGIASRRWFPLSVDPNATVAEVLRLAGLAAAFVSASLLIRDRKRRIALAVVLCGAAAFQIGYAIQQTSTQRYEIWGWRNVLVNYRITGTFVNPNHFAHYLAIILPMTMFLVAVVWRSDAHSGVSLGHRLLGLVEDHLLTAGLSALTGIAIVATILLSQSRGTALAVAAASVLVLLAIARRAGPRVLYAAAAATLVVTTVIVYLGGARAIDRIRSTSLTEGDLGGRINGLTAAAGLWKRFPAVGSGLGSFQAVVTMEQTHTEAFYHRAHNDYAEVAATAGTVGFLIAIVTLAVVVGAILKIGVGATSSSVTWNRRAFNIAALMSLAVALVHSIFDFNFFIPSNPATLAVIVGAALAPLAHDMRSRR